MAKVGGSIPPRAFLKEEKIVKPTVIDFETEAIVDGAPPPKPVGVAIWVPDQKPRYYAWGHPTENNCTEGDGLRALARVWNTHTLLFHNAAFDISVAAEHFQYPGWEQIHDTLFLLYLTDPHASTLSLKPSAERILGLPPAEQDAVRNWLIANGIVTKTDKHWGAHICKAPGKLVGKYAVGDVVRTRQLFEKLMRGMDDGMLNAYNRERRLLGLLMRNEREGMRVDVPRLIVDVASYTKALHRSENYLRRRLGDINLDSDAEVAEALDKGGFVSEWSLTPTGKRSMSKASLTLDKYSDREVALARGYRERLVTVLRQSMEPWLESAAKDGRIRTQWNQVRGERGGTRTGRLSCRRFMNISKSFTDKSDGYVHPKFLRVPELPRVRTYVLPDDDESLILHRDYQQQEFRGLAHFEGDVLQAAYIADPKLDIHSHMQAAVKTLTGLDLERRIIKINNFSILYGRGLASTAEEMGKALRGASLAEKDPEKAKRLYELGCKFGKAEAIKVRDALYHAVPGIRDLQDEIKARAKANLPLRTWGGRLYYCEPPRRINGRMVNFEYKLLNYLIQGSAADCTKEALIRYDQARKHGRLMVSVHDEINISSPKTHTAEEMRILRDVMQSIEFDVPMLSDGKVGPNWGSLKAWDDEKGEAK